MVLRRATGGNHGGPENGRATVKGKIAYKSLRESVPKTRVSENIEQLVFASTYGLYEGYRLGSIA